MRRALQGLAGLVISALAFWLTLRGKDLGAIWQAVLAGDYRWLAPYFAVMVVMYLLRVVRWRLLLEPSARVSFARVNAASAVGLMALVWLPFRLGELARPYLVADGEKLTVSAALSSIVVERVLDGLFTALLLVVALMGLPDGTPGVAALRASGAALFLAFLAALGVLVVASRSRGLAVRTIHRLLDPVSRRVAGRLAEVADLFIGALQRVPSRRKVALILALTCGDWLVAGLAIRVLAVGFGFELSLVATYTLLGIAVVGVMIPAGPGFAGTLQAAIVLSLSLFFPREAVETRGTAFANVLWAAQLGVQAAIGLPFLFSRHIGRAVRATGERPRTSAQP